MSAYNNRYELGDLLGKGGMGAVYRAQDRLTGESVALKTVLHMPNRLTFNSQSQHMNSHVALAHEFQTLASLRHPNIISVLDYGFEHQQLPFFTMTLLNQAKTITRAGEHRTTEQKIRLLIDLLQALHYLHRRGILHRDLKPSNVLVTPDNHLRVLDFGLATSDHEAAGVAGTIAYIAPEVLSGGETTSRSDLYSVGVIAFEMLTGVSPYASQDSMQIMLSIMQGKPDFSMIDGVLKGDMQARMGLAPNNDTTQLLPNAVNKTVPGDTGKRRMPKPDPKHRPLTAIVEQLMQKDPAARYADATAVIADLAALLEKPIQWQTFEVRESFLQGADFVGRTHELQQLTGALTEAERGFGSAWLVGGESGVGKSRLVNELRVQALVRGMPVLRGQGVAGGGLPYQFWRGPIRQLLLLVDVSDAEATLLSLLVPDIATVIQRPVAQPVGTLQGSDVIDAIVGVFRRVAEPILLVLEDLHWADESLAILSQLAATIDVLPLCMVGTYRTEERPHLPDELPNHKVIYLDRLRRDDIEALSRSMLGKAGVTPRIVEFLEQQTAGNCLFIVEVLRALAEEAGYLEQIAAMVIPSDFKVGGVEAILRRRLERVPSTAQPLLALAAVSGRVIDPALMVQLKAQLYSSVDLDEWLLSATDALVIEMRDNHWQFSHDKLRETIVALLPPEELRELHTEVAEAIEAVYPNDDDRAMTLFQHWYAAGDAHKARHYGLLSGKQAMNRALYDLAMHYFDAVIKLEPSQKQQAEVYLQLGRLYWHQGETDNAVNVLEQALAIASAAGQKLIHAEGLQVLAELWKRKGLYEKAHDAAVQAIDEARLLSDVSTELMALNTVCDVFRLQGEFEKAAASLQQSLSILSSYDDPLRKSVLLNTLAIVQYHLGATVLAEQTAQEALQISSDIERMPQQIQALNTLGGLAYIRGELRTAADYYERALQIMATTNDMSAPTVFQNLGALYSDLGEFARAEEMFSKALEVFEHLNDTASIINCMTNMSEMYADQEKYEYAAMYAAKAVEDSVALGSSDLECGARLNLAVVYLHQEEVDPAIDQLRVAIALDVEDYFNEAYALLGVAYLLKNDDDQATQALWQSVQHATALLEQDELQYYGWFSIGLARLGLYIVADESLQTANTAYHKGAKIAPYAGILLHQSRLIDIIDNHSSHDLAVVYETLQRSLEQ